MPGRDTILPDYAGEGREGFVNMLMNVVNMPVKVVKMP